MKKQDLIAKDNLSLINENAQLKKEIVQMKKLVSEAKKKNEYYAKIVQEEKDRATSELRRAYSIHEDAAKKMQKYDELKSFLWRVSNLSGKILVISQGNGFMLDTIPELPRFCSEKNPPRMTTVTRFYID